MALTQKSGHHRIETTLRLIQVAQAPKRVLQEIAKLDKSAFAQNLPALRKVAERKPIDVTPSLEEIHEVADKLQDVSVGTPEYWPTVLQFLTFATAAIAPTNVPPSTNSTVILSNDHIERLTFKNQIVLLDGGSFINTRFENSRIIFTENPVEMKNVQFILS